MDEELSRSDAGSEAPPFRLYSQWQVGVYSGMFTALGGGILMWLNARRLGQPRLGGKLLGIGLLAVAFSIALAVILPSTILNHLPPAVWSAGYVAIMTVLYQKHLKAPYQHHLSRGGKKARTLPLIGIAVVVYAALFIALFNALNVFPELSLTRLPKSTFAGVTALRENSTESDAKEFYDALKKIDLVSDDSFFKLTKRGEKVELGLFYAEVSPSPEEYQEIGGLIYDALERPQDFEVLFFKGETYTVPVHRVRAREYSRHRFIDAGRTKIYFWGEANRDDAEKLGRQISADGTEDDGEIMLRRDGEFVTVEAFYNRDFLQSEAGRADLKEYWRPIFESAYGAGGYKVRFYGSSPKREVRVPLEFVNSPKTAP